MELTDDFARATPTVMREPGVRHLQVLGALGGVYVSYLPPAHAVLGPGEVYTDVRVAGATVEIRVAYVVVPARGERPAKRVRSDLETELLVGAAVAVIGLLILAALVTFPMWS